MESWVGPGNEAILRIYNSRAFPYCQQWKVGWGLGTRLSCVYTILGLFRTASNGKLGGAWERGYLAYIQDHPCSQTLPSFLSLHHPGQPRSQAFTQLPVTGSVLNRTASEGKLGEGLGTRLIRKSRGLSMKSLYQSAMKFILAHLPVPSESQRYTTMNNYSSSTCVSA